MNHWPCSNGPLGLGYALPPAIPKTSQRAMNSTNQGMQFEQHNVSCCFVHSGEQEKKETETTRECTHYQTS
jgi:hypothetical protein